MPHALHEILERREQRFKLGNEVRDLYKKAKDEKRSLSDEESARVDTMLADSEKLKVDIERMERADGLIGDLAKPEGRSVKVDPDERDDEDEDDHIKVPAEGGAAEILAAFARSLTDTSGRETRKAAIKGVRDTPEYRQVFRDYLLGSAPAEALAERAKQLRIEQRDLQVDNETQAGVLVPPMQFVNELLKEIDDATFLRQWARTFQVPNAKSLGAPKRTAKASTWIWGTELQEPSVDTTLAFGMRVLHPRHATGEIKVSKPWLRSALLGPEAIVRSELAMDGAELMEQAFLTGSGSGQPLGVFTASADGISTARDVSTGNLGTEVTIDGLREAKYSIKPQYWPRLKWLGSRTFHKQLYSMDDGEGRPLLVESLKAGELDRALGFPVFISEFAPSTFTSGLYVGILGDWSYYWIADALDMELQRLDELYARTNQVGFIGRLQVDGMPVLEECWARVKLG